MFNLRKKSYKKAAEKKNCIGDVTINDFANTSQIHTRCKKAATNVFEEDIMMENEKSWDKINECSLEDNMRGNNCKVIHFTCVRKKGKNSKYQKDNLQEKEGIDYPLDLWFIISEHIPPEAVGKFANICKSSYYVTTTGKFWFHLYKTYHKFVPNLPERLQPECMMRQFGLRACVIRALHYSYFTSLFKRALDDVSYLRQEDPHSLVRRKCINMWHKRGKILYYFFFQLKDISKTSNIVTKRDKQCNTDKTEFTQMLEDVAINCEEGCKVLRITCLKYSMLPRVTGLVLQTVSISLMHDFRQHQFRLGFGTSIAPNTLTNEVIISDVTSYCILDWWNPFYPYEDSNVIFDYRPSDSI